MINDANLKAIIEKAKSQPSYNTFFDNITYKKFIDSMQQKYGIGLNKVEQACLVYKYNNWGDNIQWLYLPLQAKSCY